MTLIKYYKRAKKRDKNDKTSNVKDPDQRIENDHDQEIKTEKDKDREGKNTKSMTNMIVMIMTGGEIDDMMIVNVFLLLYYSNFKYFLMLVNSNDEKFKETFYFLIY